MWSRCEGVCLRPRLPRSLRSVVQRRRHPRRCFARSRVRHALQRRRCVSLPLLWRSAMRRSARRCPCARSTAPVCIVIVLSLSLLCTRSNRSRPLFLSLSLFVDLARSLFGALFGFVRRLQQGVWQWAAMWTRSVWLARLLARCFASAPPRCALQRVRQRRRNYSDPISTHIPLMAPLPQLLMTGSIGQMASMAALMAQIAYIGPNLAASGSRCTVSRRCARAAARAAAGCRRVGRYSTCALHA